MESVCCVRLSQGRNDAAVRLGMNREAIDALARIEIVVLALPVLGVEEHLEWHPRLKGGLLKLGAGERLDVQALSPMPAKDSLHRLHRGGPLDGRPDTLEEWHPHAGREKTQKMRTVLVVRDARPLVGDIHGLASLPKAELDRALPAGFPPAEATCLAAAFAHIAHTTPVADLETLEDRLATHCDSHTDGDDTERDEDACPYHSACIEGDDVAETNGLNGDNGKVETVDEAQLEDDRI